METTETETNIDTIPEEPRLVQEAHETIVKAETAVNDDPYGRVTFTQELLDECRLWTVHGCNAKGTLLANILINEAVDMANDELAGKISRDRLEAHNRYTSAFASAIQRVLWKREFDLIWQGQAVKS